MFIKENIGLIIGVLWASILLALGYLDIEPMILRILLIPALGLPIHFHFLLKNEKDKNKGYPLLSTFLNAFVLAPLLCSYLALIILAIFSIILNIFGIDFSI